MISARIRRTPGLAAMGLALALACGFATAQQAGTGSSVTGGGAAPTAQPGAGTRNLPTAQDDQLTRADRRFLRKAAESGMFEVQIAQLAASRAVDPRVQSFASMLVDHHTQANDELVQIANARRVELPPAPPRGLRRQLENLAKKTGEAFDRDFVREVGIKAHERDIKLFEKAAKDAKDPQLRAFAARKLPTLRQHLGQAERLPQSGKSDAAARGPQGIPRSGGA